LWDFGVTDWGWYAVLRRPVARAEIPFGARDAVVQQRPSRHDGLEVTVAALERGPRFRAYVHTPDWGRVLVVSTGASAEAAMARAEALVTQAVGEGVEIRLPAARRPGRLQSADDTAPVRAATANVPARH
jgi:hypothetical protein